MKPSLVLSLDQVGMKDIALVGGKCASLGEMIRNLSALGVAVPPGFAITTEVYWRFLRANQLESLIEEQIAAIDHNNLESLRRCGQKIRQSIRNAKFPYDLGAEIIEAYECLSQTNLQEYTDVAVRSS